MAGPGDVTGDGVPDFLVASLAPPDLYSGATGTLAYSLPPVYTVPVVGAPGDTNWDAVPDLLVGYPGYGNGVAFLYSGIDGSLLQSLPAVPGPGCDQLGYAVAGIGDIDGDGAGDVVLGAPHNGSSCTPTPGTAHVYSGGTGSLLAVVTGPTALFSQFGSVVAGLGDVSGDGVPDFAVNGGLVTFGPPLPPPQIWVFSGADFSLVTLLTGQVGEGLGRSLAGPGDVDGDGVPDLFTGAPNADPSSTSGYAGRAALFSGDDWSEIYSLTPPPGEFLNQGWSVCGSDDVDSDGFPELAVGAPGSPYFVTGKVRLYSGSPIGVSSFGTGCAGAMGVPRMGATRSPKVGT
ncbi:MAG: integrin alpha, partial [Planctomycetota bacterium]